MKKASLLSFLFVCLSLSGWAQKGLIKGFDFDKFNVLDKEAEWLCKYDRVAWITSDSVMTEPDSVLKSLGTMWFVVPGKENIWWWAFYGRMDGGVFTEVLSYYVDTSGTIHKNISLPYDKTLNQSLATAISNAMARMVESQPASYQKIRHNQYVRVLADNTIQVWILPAYQPTSVAVYGGDYTAIYSADGTKRVSESYNFLEEPMGFKTSPSGRTITVQYPQLKTPPLCAIFFARYYAPYFKNIYLECDNSNSMLVTEKDGSYWVHAAKEPEKKKKNKK
ncbi:hypothetical protein BH09BAC1_BH09BAC1_16890 [soil metagenome]